MLIDSRPVDTSADASSEQETQQIDQWQTELGQFLADTMARLDSLSALLNQWDAEAHEVPSSSSEAEEPDHGVPQAPNAESEIGTLEELLPDVPVALTEAPPAQAASEQTAVEHSRPSDVTSTPWPTHDRSLSRDQVAPTEPEANITESKSNRTDEGDSMLDPDEAWARLSAIKSRIAKQLENQ